MDSTWITWETQRRNRSMARLAGAELLEMNYHGNKYLRHITLSLRTLSMVFKAKPKRLYYQNPSLLLSFLVVAAHKTALRGRSTLLIGDYHNAGVYPPHFGFITRWIASKSDLVIVTNSALANEVAQWGAKPIVFPDPIPDLKAPRRSETRPPRNPASFLILFICSWAEDEPVANVIEAAKALQRHGVVIHITGRPKWTQHCGKDPIPDNVKLLGFLSEEDYESALFEADLTMDLTTREDCLVCGAYESVAAEIPMILSGNSATRDLFFKGAVYTDNTAESIQNCALLAKGNRASLKGEIISLKSILLERQDQSKLMLEEALSQTF